MSTALTLDTLTRSYPTRYGFETNFSELKDFIDDDIFAFDAISSGTFANTSVAGNFPGALVAGAATSDNSGANIQATGCTHVLAAGRSHRFIANFAPYETTSANGATESDLWFGAMTVDTSIIASQTSLYGVYFRKDEGDTNIDCAYCINGTVTDVATAAATLAQPATSTLGTIANYEVRITSSPGSATSTLLEWFIDGVLVASANITTLLTSNKLLWSLAYQTGDNTGTKGILLRRAASTCNLI